MNIQLFISLLKFEHNSYKRLSILIILVVYYFIYLYKKLIKDNLQYFPSIGARDISYLRGSIGNISLRTPMENT